ncbi:hypothetical protein SAMN04487949_3621 [Halogranum gelatinilyticum]|uniref:Uncharacterized protein n=1 Tax=Halogranum gelatinilyticum TaxID=660521 RepID=A0A1G9ZEC3_9EURY|nr:hypothetical protein [Halogranum gelatinilyticum]SDN19467.1 hypothetical protein SAMN04487949_3621 [Halogranum gelatinilyticum]
MRPCTRRHALHGAAAALLVGLAGCSGSNSSSRTATASERPVPDDAETDPAHVQLRSTADAAAVRHPDDETPTDDEDDSFQFRSHPFVASRETADGLTFGDGVDDESVAAARRLLAETDFDSETVYLEQRRIRECFALDLCYVRWDTDRVETQYGRRLLPADVACETDTYDVVATLVRIPAALDPEDVSRFSSGTSGSGCRPPEGDR